MLLDDKNLDLIGEVAATFDGTAISVTVGGAARSPLVPGGSGGQIRISGKRRHRVVLYPIRGSLGIAAIDHLATATAGTSVAVVVVAAAVSPAIQRTLIDRGFGYLDLAGNCHLELDDGNVTIHIEGRRSARRPKRTGSLRAAGHQVLFALLADPDLLQRTVREIATVAHASRHAVHGLLDRLRDEGALQRSGRSRHTFAPWGRTHCLDRFTAGWADVLRGGLLAGRFRLREHDPLAQVTTIHDGFRAAGVQFGFGGGHGSAQWIRYLKSDDLVVHASAWTPALAKRLGAVPDRQGPLFVFRTMTSLDLASGIADTAHPLLIHAELARSPDPRTREAAGLLLSAIEDTPR